MSRLPTNGAASTALVGFLVLVAAGCHAEPALPPTSDLAIGSESQDGGNSTDMVVLLDMANCDAQNGCGNCNPNCGSTGRGGDGDPFVLSSDSSPDPLESDCGVVRDGEGGVVGGACRGGAAPFYSLIVRGCRDTMGLPRATAWRSVNWASLQPKDTSITLRASAGNTPAHGETWGAQTVGTTMSPLDLAASGLLPNESTGGDGFLAVDFVFATSKVGVSATLQSFKVMYECDASP